jgi:hypothetical protein
MSEVPLYRFPTEREPIDLHDTSPHSGLRRDSRLDITQESVRMSAGPAYVPAVLPTVGMLNGTRSDAISFRKITDPVVLSCYLLRGIYA